MERAYPLPYITAGTPGESFIKPRSSSDLEDWHFIPLQMAAWATGLQLFTGQGEGDLERTLAWEMEGQRGTLPCPQQHTRVCKFPLGGGDTTKVAGLEPPPLRHTPREPQLWAPAPERTSRKSAGDTATTGVETMETSSWTAK